MEANSNEFIPYEEALALEKLGFNDVCLGSYKLKDNEFQTNGMYSALSIVQAPLFQQAFKFFREKHGYFTSPTQSLSEIIQYDWLITKDKGDGKRFIHLIGYHNTYGEAELACIKKLIELCKKD